MIKGTQEKVSTSVWITQKVGKERGNSYRKNEHISGRKRHTNTWKLIWNWWSFDKKGVNVCEHMVKTTISASPLFPGFPHLLTFQLPSLPSQISTPSPKPINVTHSVVNLSSQPLTASGTSVLSKGLSFSPKPCFDHFNSCWNAFVLRNLPPNTNYSTCHHLKLSYQFILSSRYNPGINLSWFPFNFPPFPPPFCLASTLVAFFQNSHMAQSLPCVHIHLLSSDWERHLWSLKHFN